MAQNETKWVLNPDFLKTKLSSRPADRLALIEIEKEKEVGVLKTANHTNQADQHGLHRMQEENKPMRLSCQLHSKWIALVL